MIKIIRHVLKISSFKKQIGQSKIVLNKLRILGFGLTLFYWVNPVHALGTYTLKEISLVPTAISNNDKIIGSRYYLYDITTGVRTDIRTLANGKNFSQVNDVNNSLEMVGLNYAQAYELSPDGIGYILRLPNDIYSSAYSVNEIGDIVGYSAPSNTTCIVHGLYANSNATILRDLGSLGGIRTYAYDINDKNQIVGQSSINSATDCKITTFYHAFITTDIGLKDLHSSTMGGNLSTAYKINNNSQVVGDFANGLVTQTKSSYYPQGYPIRHAVLWNIVSNTYTDLGNGSKDSSLRAINAFGQFVGYERTYSNNSFTTMPSVSSQYGVVGDMGTPKIVYLNSLITNLPVGWSVNNAIDINNSGKIVGTAKDSKGYTHGILLTPTTPISLAAKNKVTSLSIKRVVPIK